MLSSKFNELSQQVRIEFLGGAEDAPSDGCKNPRTY
jgi:hypothetical protein